MGDKSRPPMIPETLPNSYCEEEVENTKTTEETDQSENTIDNAISDLKVII